MKLDPELEGSLPSPFTLSVEPCGRDAYQHGYHLGTDFAVARAFAEEIFRRVNSHCGCYTVALKRGRDVVDVFDGRDWYGTMSDGDPCKWQAFEEIHR